MLHDVCSRLKVTRRGAMTLHRFWLTFSTRLGSFLGAFWLIFGSIPGSFTSFGLTFGLVYVFWLSFGLIFGRFGTDRRARCAVRRSIWSCKTSTEERAVWLIIAVYASSNAKITLFSPGSLSKVSDQSTGRSSTRADRERQGERERGREGETDRETKRHREATSRSLGLHAGDLPLPYSKQASGQDHKQSRVCL